MPDLAVEPRPGRDRCRADDAEKAVRLRTGRTDLLEEAPLVVRAGDLEHGSAAGRVGVSDRADARRDAEPEQQPRQVIVRVVRDREQPATAALGGETHVGAEALAQDILDSTGIGGGLAGRRALLHHLAARPTADVAADDPLESLAREKHVTYVKLDGEVGVLGNGAGLTMSTVDVVTFAGGRPANFCDLGGGGDAQGVVDALSVITRDPQVKAIFFNIFGGITRCDEVARGILQALGEMSLELPIVVRLDGTNAEEGRAILADAAPANLRVSPTMLEAAKLAVELAA